MTEFIRYAVPDTRDQIIASLEAVDAQATALWQGFSETEFFAPPAGGGWSPAQNVEHLVKTTAPVAKALRLPRLALRLLFGAAKIPSRTFIEVRAAYRQVLAEGGQAGRFGPRERGSSTGRAPTRPQVLNQWRHLMPSLALGIRRWDEAALDRYRLPHPLLGKLTLREMLFFTLYHVGHHAEIVAARQARPADSA
jgi:hypothetical protein